MANDYFQFQKFRVSQDKCAMKVSTDACLFGAWVPLLGKKVLDVGAGTGLLSLMAAQRLKGTGAIQAIEIDPQAAQQARENFDRSPYKDQIQLINGDFCTWCTQEKFHTIICNPPFFSDSTKSLDQSRAQARHEASLTLATLISKGHKLLTADGNLGLMLPADRLSQAIQEITRHIYVRGVMMVKPTQDKENNRVFIWASPTEGPRQTRYLTIYQTHGHYTLEAERLLREFYLRFADKAN